MNLINLFFILIIIFIFILFRLIKWMRCSIKTRRIIKIWICLASLMLYFLFSFISFKIFMSNFSKPSTVDISPFLEINNADFSDLDAIINKLQQSLLKLGEDFEMTKVQRPSLSCVYDYRNDMSSTSVSIYLFDDDEMAKVYFNELSSKLRSGNILEGYIEGSAGVYMKKSENIEAILGDSSITRSAGTFYELEGVNAQRIIGTSVRVNNIYIMFMEYGHNDGNIGKSTNEAIINLCEVLAEFIK